MSTTMTRTALDAGLFSADSHVIEPADLWRDVLPANFWGTTPRSDKPGGTDPELRCGEMVQDGVVAEVLYATLGLRVFGVQDPATQEEACRVYNDWLANYFSVAPDRLLGIALIAAFDADRAVAEIERCGRLGYRGIMLWQVPHPDLPFRSHHYDPIWEAAVEAQPPGRTPHPLRLRILHQQGRGPRGAVAREPGRRSDRGLPPSRSPAPHGEPQAVRSDGLHPGTRARRGLRALPRAQDRHRGERGRLAPLRGHPVGLLLPEEEHVRPGRADGVLAEAASLRLRRGEHLRDLLP